jgi:hypothetical protein
LSSKVYASSILFGALGAQDVLKVATGLYKYTTMWYCPGVFVILARAGKKAAAAFVANLPLSLVG